MGDLSRLKPEAYYGAVLEIICFLLHLCDRRIFEVAPHLRQARMDALVIATLSVFANEISQDLEDPTEATEVARRMFSQRMRSGWMNMLL